jgi:hypothetical protein
MLLFTQYLTHLTQAQRLDLLAWMLAAPTWHSHQWARC